MNRHLVYLKYVIRHKWYVFQACRELGVPLIQALLHDWSKFLPSEWSAYANTFYNADGTKKPYAETEEFALAWCLHQKRNPHHWQFWLLYWDRGELEPMLMPARFVREMVADWVGAGLSITGRREAGEWYHANKDKMKLHPMARAYAEQLLKKVGQ